VRTVIVLPTYNERENIVPFLRAARSATVNLTGPVNVLVIDDNSPDGTAELARSVGAELGNVEVIVRPRKDGLGSAYRAGFRRALDDGYDVIVSMDADMSHDPTVIPEMLRLIEGGADAVVGSRYVPGGGTTDWPIHRQLLSKWGNTYTRGVLRLTPRDCTSGFRAYRSDVLATIDPASTTAEGYAFLTELVRRMTRHGYSVAETPIVFRDRIKGKSKMSGRIIIESMLLVTRWAAVDIFKRSARR
jgi:dolichol-phosphate mannosyltransferase